ncbi:MAG: hypothetical protein PSV13_15755 [Lacunisphaera sp.]|nr:hypothetical protein [Lacunisphaera sp.]
MNTSSSNHDDLPPREAGQQSRGEPPPGGPSIRINTQNVPLNAKRMQVTVSPYIALVAQVYAQGQQSSGVPGYQSEGLPIVHPGTALARIAGQAFLAASESVRDEILGGVVRMYLPGYGATDDPLVRAGGHLMADALTSHLAGRSSELLLKTYNLQRGPTLVIVAVVADELVQVLCRRDDAGLYARLMVRGKFTLAWQDEQVVRIHSLAKYPKQARELIDTLPDLIGRVPVRPTASD